MTYEACKEAVGSEALREDVFAAAAGAFAQQSGADAKLTGYGKLRLTYYAQNLTWLELDFAECLGAALDAALAHPGSEALREAYEDDPTSDERWNAGCDFAMKQLCEYVEVDPQNVRWDAATETVDGDVQAVIGNILREAYGDDWQTRAALAHPGSGDAEPGAEGEQ